jgi:hypothetical protein
VYACATCRTHLCSADSVVSRAFHGRHGRAFLVGECVNTRELAAESRVLLTGVHTVRDCRCRGCGTVVGWRYVHAEETAQQYKVGKYIVERECIVREEGWRDEPPAAA